VRPLGLAGVRAAVVAPPGAPARYSRHTRSVLPWRDAWQRPDELVDALVRYGEAQPEPPVLFYQEDRTLLLVSRYRDRLRQAFRFVVPDQTLVEQLVDKARFQALAASLGLPVPRARLLAPADGRPFPHDLDLTFPIVIKPVTRVPSQWEPVAGPGKAARIDRLETLRALWPRLAVAGGGLPLIAQELVPGPETCIESYHTYVDARGRIVGEFTGRKIRTLPATYGDSTALETTDAPDVRALGRALIDKVGLQGVAKLDFKRGPDGRLHLLEVNPRFNLWHHLGAAAGVNLPALVYADLTGAATRRRPAAPARAGVRWCKPWKDIRAARAAGVSLVAWVPWALRCPATSGAAWDDPLPLIGAGLWRGWGALQRKIAGPFVGDSAGEPPLSLHVPTR
ncbi:MAG: ATP-grasp domain-containing protein, partial [Gemmatimonadales bacterium]